MSFPDKLGVATSTVYRIDPVMPGTPDYCYRAHGLRSWRMVLTRMKIV